MLDCFKNIIFDFDNTLYDERQYLFPVFQSIATSYASNDCSAENELFNFLCLTFTLEGRENLYDKLIKRYNISSLSIDSMLEIQRNIELPVKLQLFPEAAYVIQSQLALNKNLFIATNGNKQQQLNKLSQLQWGTINYSMIRPYFACDYKPKPSPDVILAIINDFQLAPSETVFVGDAITDEDCARNAGICFIYTNKLFK